MVQEKVITREKVVKELWYKEKKIEKVEKSTV